MLAHTPTAAAALRWVSRAGLVLLGSPVLAASAQVFVPGRRDITPPPPPPRTASPQAAPAKLPSPRSLLVERLKWSTTPLSARVPQRFGRCAFDFELPDSLGVHAAPGWTQASEIAAAPDWTGRAFVTASDVVIPVRVLGALCGDSTVADPIGAQPYAAFEIDGRYGLLSLDRQTTPIAAQEGRVRLGGAPWSEVALVTKDSLRHRVVLSPLTPVIASMRIREEELRRRSTAEREELQRQTAEQVAAAEAEAEREARERARVETLAKRRRVRERTEGVRTAHERRIAEYRRRGWSEEVIRAVIAGRIFVGMTGAQVRAAWGAPGGINRSVNSYGVHEQWVYGLGNYVYVEGGVVTSFQTSQ